MKDEIKAALEEAIAPLKQDIETLKAQLAALTPLAKMAKATDPQPARRAECSRLTRRLSDNSCVSASVGCPPKKFKKSLAGTIMSPRVEAFEPA